MARKVNCNKNGTDYYRITATVGRDSNGKLIRKEFYGKSKSDAEAKRDEYLDGIKNGLNVNYKNVTFGSLMKTWLYEIERIKVKPSTFERYEGIFRNYIVDSELYGVKLYELKTLQIQRFYNDLYFNKHKSSRSVDILNKHNRTFFTYAINEGYLLKIHALQIE